MLKILLCVGAFSLCLLLAWLLTRKYRLRKDFYYNLSLFNERLYNEVSYTREPLPSFIEKQPFGGDFKKILTERSANGFRPGDCAIPYLKEDERKFLDDYLSMIGKSDAASQKKLPGIPPRRSGGAQAGERRGVQKAFFSLYKTRRAGGVGSRHPDRVMPSEGAMDIDIIFKIAAVGIIVTIVCQILKKSDRDDIATIVSLAGLIIVLTVVLDMVADLFGSIRSIFDLF